MSPPPPPSSSSSSSPDLFACAAYFAIDDNLSQRVRSVAEMNEYFDNISYTTSSGNGSPSSNPNTP